MDEKTKQLLPRIPLDLDKYDLSGVKINREHEGHNIFSPYKPNVNGMVCPVIFLTHQHYQIGYSVYIDNLDLTKGDLFLVNVPITNCSRFMVDIEKVFGFRRISVVRGITIDTIFNIPIYNNFDFIQLVKYYSPFGFYDQLGLSVKNPKPSGRPSNHRIYDSLHYNQRCLLALLKNRYFNNLIKLKQTENGLDSKFTYSSTPEQLKLAWNTRHLELIDF